ncbi:MAG: arylsulfatase [Chitinophagaceae bacterium]|nr:arylsulfatase [Chitinophagaceae bacterium]
MDKLKNRSRDNKAFNVKADGLKSMLPFFFLLLSSFARAQLPNIVYILADDLGYGDISVYNPDGKISTPNIDRLARNGMRFTDAHTASAVCTPSRYGILTGRYPWRSRLPVGVLRGYSRTLIEEDQPTVATLLKTSDYRTAVIGKWHLGLDWVPKEAFKDSIDPAYYKNNMYGIRSEMDPDQIDFLVPPVRGPRTQGFDYSYILPASLDMPPYVYLENDALTEMPTGYTPGNELESGYTGPFWRAGLMAPSFDFYQVLPVFTNKAIDFIRNHADGKAPFFLYFPMPAPHTPWVPASEFTGKSGAGEYGDYVQEVDAAVGRVLRTLDSMRLTGNTVVVFASDNGPYWRQNFADRYHHKATGEFRGMKGDIFEGGHRVPFIVSYPGVTRPGTVSNATIALTCLMATCKDMLGNRDKKFETGDSYSILPVLSGEASIVRDQPAIVHISSKGFMAIRKGPWKLINHLGSGGFSDPAEIIPAPGDPAGQLYNLETDVHEDHNLYNAYPENVRELSELLLKIQTSKTKITQPGKG